MTRDDDLAERPKSTDTCGLKKSSTGHRFRIALMATALLAGPSLVIADETRAESGISDKPAAATQLEEQETKLEGSLICESATADTEPFYTFSKSSDKPALSYGTEHVRGQTWARNSLSFFETCTCTGFCYPVCRIVSCNGSPLCCRSCEAWGCYSNCPPTGGGVN